ncbi:MULTISPECIES: hypothetical protein [Thermoactinomyces]|uniref:Uncharacterized protein n=1 Tax=Thermoactinomyces daqus TaxID=1329516 RepID=A0A7W1XA48_9BACL|nr:MULTISPECIES: hypothetical protein [Thermoactinomyces]MBA4542831.1 hypothetical protein [Thermoactinomyces daqus]MBH8598496.1 hypothetical protein [Thermoactinomyces sp. CICC 10523]MBH8604659.1 hypothetical protein [Thermoactinomyces sp. CICC 10522]MBH8606880.1 hypothetical protein [Thermoactinomyces sp. CICC 10521]
MQKYVCSPEHPDYYLLCQAFYHNREAYWELKRFLRSQRYGLPPDPPARNNNPDPSPTPVTPVPTPGF